MRPTRMSVVLVLMQVLVGCGRDDAATPPATIPAATPSPVIQGSSGPTASPPTADDTRYASARVGDWIAQTLTGVSAGEVRRTVVAKDAKFATIKEETTRGGETLVEETKYRLDKTYELAAAPGAQDEKLGEGDETLRVGDRDYACHWVHVKRTWDMGGQPRHSDIKIWRCKDVPFGGIVRSDVTGMVGTHNAMMTGCGRGK